VKILFPAILTVWISLACRTGEAASWEFWGWRDAGQGYLNDDLTAQRGGITPVDEVDSTLPDGQVVVETPFPLRIRDLKGTHHAGRVSQFDDRGLSGEIGAIPWIDLAPADRFRIGRDALRKSRRDDVVGRAWLLFMLRSTDSGEFCDRAERLLRARAGVDADRIIAAAEMRAQEVRGNAEAVRLAAESERLKQGRPHLRSASVAPWAVPDPIKQGSLAEQLRIKGESAAEGLGLKGVRTGSTVVLGLASLESLARDGVAFDRLTSEIAPRLGLRPGRNPFPGALLVMEVVDHDTLRLMAGTIFDHEAPHDDDSILFPTDDGPFAIMAMPDNDGIAAISAGMSGGDPIEMLRSLERARIVARACLVHAHTRRSLPAWLVEGIAEYLASILIEDAPIDSIRRERALRSMRDGRAPGWILGLDGDGEGFDLDGLARDVSFVLVTRLFETDPRTVPGLVADLKGGMTVDEAFRRWTGMTAGAWFEDTADWFRFND
jgi:hypothetical protein